MFSKFICWFVFFVLSAVVPEAAKAQGYYPNIRQDVFIRENSHYLNVPRVGTYTVYDIFDCTFKCLSKPSCLSLNLAASKGADGKLWCELLSSEKYSNPKEYKANESSHHFSMKTPCMSSPCQNGGTCVANRYKYHSFEFHCSEGFLGEHCEIALKSSCKDLYDHNVDKVPLCERTLTKNPENCGYNEGQHNLVSRASSAFKMADLAQKTRNKAAKILQESLNVSQVVTLIFDSKPTSVLCHMGDFGCGDGGWTPVMKIDGNKQTFHFSSALWSDKETFNVVGGETGFDSQEAKLPSYWNTSFSKICLGMKISQQINFAVIAKQANSLHSLIADGQYRATSLGRETWKSLIGSQASLQINCNKEGFNAVSGKRDNSKARIGFLGNRQEYCYSCNSRIGFGTGGLPDNNSTCGNEATNQPDNNPAHIRGMGYIFVQ